MQPYAVFAALILLQGLACGQSSPHPGTKEDLEPIECVLTYHTPDYHLKLRQQLMKRAPRTSDLQLLVLPSFEPEVLLSIYADEDGFEAQVVRPTEQIWYHEGRVEEIEVKVTKRSFPRDVATRLKALWKAMLLRTRYQLTDVQMLDGVSYCFLSFELGGGSLSGQTHSPAKGTQPYLLAEIGRLVIGVVETEETEEEEALAELSRLMDGLEAKLIETAAAERRGIK